MNILYLLNSGQPGGMEQHVLDLVSGMVKKGHDVWVWCPQGPINEWYISAGAKVHVTSLKFDLDPQYISKLRVFLQKHKIEVLHTHELAAGGNGLLSGFLAGVPVKISHIHTPLSEWQHKSTVKKFIGKISQLGYSLEVNALSDTEIALTDSRKKVKIREGIKEEKLVVIPNGLDLTRFNTDLEQKVSFSHEIRERYDISKNALIIGNVSRTTVEKNQKIIIEAYKELVDSNPELLENTHVLISGGGELEEELKDLACNYGLATKITVTGRFHEDDLVKMYSAMDLFVFPSLAEGFGFVLIEAAYMNLPILCSDIEVLHEVAAGTVKYFNPNDSSELSHLLASSIDNLGDLTVNGTDSLAKKRVAELYSLDKFISSYEQLYLRFLAKKLGSNSNMQPLSKIERRKTQ